MTTPMRGPEYPRYPSRASSGSRHAGSSCFGPSTRLDTGVATSRLADAGPSRPARWTRSGGSWDLGSGASQRRSCPRGTIAGMRSWCGATTGLGGRPRMRKRRATSPVASSRAVAVQAREYQQLAVRRMKPVRLAVLLRPRPLIKTIREHTAAPAREGVAKARQFRGRLGARVDEAARALVLAPRARQAPHGELQLASAVVLAHDRRRLGRATL